MTGNTMLTTKYDGGHYYNLLILAPQTKIVI